ncbi:MAG: hypothetical protein NTV30_04990 [Chloroflexi bacterium]|nr:hypothetical protein [Chloroflexota bacterium]
MTERARKLNPKHIDKSKLKKKHITRQVISNMTTNTNQQSAMQLKADGLARSTLAKKVITYDFRYVINDLKRIGIVTGLMILIIVVLAIVYK